jgi:hypothetical protein
VIAFSHSRCFSSSPVMAFRALSNLCSEGPEPARLPRSASTRQVEEVTRYLERAAAQRFPARRARDSRDVEVLARHQSDDLPAVCPALRSGCSHAILTGPKIPL